VYVSRGADRTYDRAWRLRDPVAVGSRVALEGPLAHLPPGLARRPCDARRRGVELCLSGAIEIDMNGKHVVAERKATPIHSGADVPHSITQPHGRGASVLVSIPGIAGP